VSSSTFEFAVLNSIIASHVVTQVPMGVLPIGQLTSLPPRTHPERIG
jgi:hypothetical protein